MIYRLDKMTGEICAFKPVKLINYPKRERPEVFTEISCEPGAARYDDFAQPAGDVVLGVVVELARVGVLVVEFRVVVLATRVGPAVEDRGFQSIVRSYTDDRESESRGHAYA